MKSGRSAWYWPSRPIWRIRYMPMACRRREEQAVTWQDAGVAQIGSIAIATMA